jgi:preprotein translocase subunit SecY
VFAVVFVLVMGLIVFMTEAIRKVPIQYAKRQRGTRTYGGQMTHLPIRVNVAGVLPIIFAVSLMLVPEFAARILIASNRPELIDLGQQLTIWFQPTSWMYMAFYFLTVFVFTFFSALIFFNTEDISTELKKSGAFIPGIRPGGPTQKFLEFVVTRITLAGAVFLGFVAVMPSIAQIFTGIPSLAIGGTGVLIVVSVILETRKQAESMMIEQNYDKYLQR